MNQQLHTTEDIAQLIEVEPDIVVTIIENATVFEGPESVYRYDLPAVGIRDGWAVQAVIDQIALMLGGSWPNVEVAVDAQPEVAAVLVEALLGKGVGAYRAEVERHAPPEEVEDPVSHHPKHKLRQSPRFDVLRGINPVFVAGAALIVVIVVLAWWLIGKSMAPDPQPAPKPALMAKESSQVALPSTAQPVPEAAEENPFDSEQVLLEHDLLRVQLPVGYRLEGRDDGMVAALGPDENLRVLLSAEFVGQLPGEHIASEVHHMIEQDPALSASSPTGVGRGEPELAYVEEPGDGSTVTWSVWVQDGHLYSVGCHTRQQPTLSQKAACRMAASSLNRIDHG